MTSKGALRSISVGTDLTTSIKSTWQQARPWYMSDAEGSNTAADNARTMSNLFSDKTVAVFGVPAPFTGTCEQAHYPPYKQAAAAFAEAGVDKVICYSVADPYAHYGWAKGLGNDFDAIEFMADPSGDWAKEMELDIDFSETSLGLRSKRFSMLVQDGVVKAFHMVDEAEKDAEVLLQAAQELE